MTLRLLLILALVWLLGTCRSGAPEVSSDVAFTMLPVETGD